MSLSSNATEFVPFSTYNWGQNGPYKLTARLPWNPIVYCLIASLHAIAFWMSLELTIHLFYTFKRQGTLYFWYVFQYRNNQIGT